MRRPKHTVRAHRQLNGVIVYSLLQGGKKPKTIRRFGYGTVHRIWYDIQPYSKTSVAMTAARAAEVKEQIAQWCK